MNILAPSMLSIDFGHMEDELKRAVSSGADTIHVDIMDGQFVPNISFGPPVIRYVRKAVPDAVLDVHMMVKNPAKYFERLINLGAGILTIHAEATDNLRTDLLTIRDAGVKAGVAISPDTSIKEIEYVMDIVDMVLVMSVYPGFGGQKFIQGTYEKIAALKDIRDAKGLDFDIEVDGGVTLDNVRKVLESGANVIVAGSAVFNDNIEDNVKGFLEILSK